MKVASRKHVWIFLIAALAVAVLGVACSSGDVTAPEPTTAPVAPAPTTAPSSPVPAPTVPGAAPTSESSPVPTPVPATGLIHIPDNILQAFPIFGEYHWSRVEWSPGSITGVGRAYGGTMRLAQPVNPPSWDTASPIGDLLSNFSSPWYNRLLTFDMSLDKAFAGEGNVHKLLIKGDLADSWEVSTDLTGYTFELKENINWQNVSPTNGRHFTAEDVVYNIERLGNPDLSGASSDIYRDVTSVTAVGDYTVRIETGTPNAGFIYAISGALNNMVPREAVEDGTLDRVAVGTGAYIMESYVQNDRTVGIKNPDYFKEGRPFIDRVEWYNIVDPTARIAAFRTGQLDEYTYRGWPDAKAIFDNPGELPYLVYVNEQNSGAVHHIGFRVDEAPFDDKRVRQAMALAIDYEASIQALYEGNGRIAFNAVPTDWDGGRQFPRTQAEGSEWYNYDPERARALLAEAGYEPGELTMQMLVPTVTAGSALPSDAALYMEYWRAVGIEVEPVLLDNTTWRSRVYASDWPEGGFYFGLSMTGGTDLNDWVDLVRTGTASNRYNVSNPELDAMIDAQKLAFDRTEREQIGEDIADYVYENLEGRIFLPTPFFYHFFRPWVQGFVGHDVYFWAGYWGLSVLEEAWIDPSRMN
jgi:peptide/nickel transport system substrate-binding protein